MDKDLLKEPNYVEELLEIIRSDRPNEEIRDLLSDYHENDIADALEQLTSKERKKLYGILGPEKVSEIVSYLDDPALYLSEMELERAAEVISHMDSDDAVDVLEDMDEEIQEKLVEMMDDESSRDIQLIQSYDDDEIGSKMTTNYIVIKYTLTIRQAMRELVVQAGENDNISTLYVVDENDIFYGALDLKDLIIAREYVKLEELVTTSYPFVHDHEKISECIERIKDYAEDSIPVLTDDGHIVGIITAQDLVEVVDDELGEDYAKFAGLTAEEDLKETNVQSMKKRLPWLIVLLFLGMMISSVIGVFEGIVAVIPIVICFQSLILDMAGNVGTQSLAVTIRVLMDEELTGANKRYLVFKEMRVGFSNGMLLGVIAFAFVGCYTMVFKHYPAGSAFMISGCVAVSLLVAMTFSSLVGTLIPLFFHRLGVDPAVASGPLITTVNDLVAVVTYYGLAYVFLVNLVGMV